MNKILITGSDGFIGSQITNGVRKLKLGSTHPTRDFNYIKDTVRGFISVASSEPIIGQVINIGSNYEISIGDSAKLIADIMGVEIEIETDHRRLRPSKSEVERLWADNTKARECCGWEPEYAGLEGFRRGLIETIEWFTDPTNLSNYKSGIYNI